MIGTVTKADRREAAKETVGFRRSPATWAKARMKARRWLSRRKWWGSTPKPKAIYAEPNFPAHMVLSEAARILRLG